MSQPSALRLRGFAGFVAALLLFGCGGGGKGVRIEGKLVKNGQPVKVPEGMTVTLAFAGTDPKGGAAVYPAAVSSDGSFVADNVPPGKYQLRVGLSGGSNDPKGLARLEELNRDYKEASKYLDYEVPNESSLRITVDIGNFKVSKQ